MPTRPVQGGSPGTWGTELNAWLDVAHNTDGTLKTGSLDGLDSDSTFAANSDSRVPTQKAVKTAIANAGSLTAVAVKTANYTAAAGDFVPVDTTSGTVTVTLPNAPADGTRVGIKHVIQGGTNAVTVVCAGSDVFNKASGSTSGTLPLLNQGFILHYKASSHIWYVEADDLPLSQLDLRYAAAGVQSGVLHTVAASGSSQAVNYATADTWDITLTAACTLTLAGFTAGKADFLTLILRQDGTGSRLVTWPTITWIGSGIPPTLQTAAGSVDSVVLWSFDGGTTVYGIAQTSASGLRTGTSFPGSPADRDLFYRTDREILYEWNATVGRWLAPRERVPFTGSEVSNGSALGGIYGWVPIFGDDIYVESLEAKTRAGTTNDGSNFFSVVCNVLTAGLSGVSIASFTTAADAANQISSHLISINTLYAAATYAAFDLTVTKNGAPNKFDLPAYLVLRRCG